MKAKTTTKDIVSKKGAEKIAVLTAYDAIFARLADEAGADAILVGDSVGNTFLGFDNTVGVTLEMMIHHTAAVARAKPRALVLADLPFAFAALEGNGFVKACARLLREGGADALKLEGGAEIAAKISTLTNAGIPVMGHIGLKPQQVLQLGGYRMFGKTKEEEEALLGDALAIQDAGAFSVLMELVSSPAAARISQKLSVPTIGIGSGAGCDGQVLVCADILGLSAYAPKFAKKYADLGEAIRGAFSSYVEDVRAEKFPEQK